MGELSKTLKNYKNTYISRLAKYLDDHEDNTESLFLQKELDASNEALETLNTYKTNSKPFGFKTLKDHFDISILENSGFDLDKVDNHIASINRILDFIKHKQESMVPGEETTVNDKSNSDPEKSENLYPRIFKNYYAYSVFKKLLEQFGNTKNNLANYSFVYHSMIKDKLIYHNIKQLEYYDLLADFDISINRITGVNSLGNTQFRESIYAAAK
jgi:hypothetical protein